MDQFEKEFEEDINKLDDMMKDELSAIKDKYAELKKQRKKKYTQDKKQFEKQEEKAPRKTIPKTLKNQVWDQYIGKDKGMGNCECCKKEIDSKHFECGHIIAVSTGGQDTIDNLRPICSLCNKSMGKMNMIEFCDKYMKPVIKPTDNIINSKHKNNTFEELKDKYHQNLHRIMDLKNTIEYSQKRNDTTNDEIKYWQIEMDEFIKENDDIQEHMYLIDSNKTRIYMKQTILVYANRQEQGFQNERIYICTFCSSIKVL
jgi:hypothetical protein